MLGRLAGVWSWLVDGTSEAAGWMLDRLRPRPRRTVAIGGDEAEILDRHGSVLARLVGSEGAFRLDPPEAARRLSGSAIDIAVPPAWVFRRQLEPVAAQGAPFLHAFVQHQIERITPWRAEDVHLRILSAPLPGDPSRLAVEIATVPRRLTAGLVEALRACGPECIALVAPGADGRRVVLPLEDRGAVRAARRRPTIALALAAFLLGWPAALGWLWWTTAGVTEEIAEADAVIEQRKAVLAAAARHGPRGRARRGGASQAARGAAPCRRHHRGLVGGAARHRLCHRHRHREGRRPPFWGLDGYAASRARAGELRTLRRGGVLRHDHAGRGGARRPFPHHDARPGRRPRGTSAVSANVAFPRPVSVGIVLAGVALLGALAVALAWQNHATLVEERDAKLAYVARSLAPAGSSRARRPGRRRRTAAWR